MLNEEREEQPGQNGDAPEEQPDEKEQLAEGYLAQLKRTQADLENMQKRMEAEKARIIESANESLVCALLETIDNFERALASMKAAESSDRDGVRFIFEGFVKVLEEKGLERICAEGQFDPYKHEAVMQAAGEPSEDGKILEEFQQGYTFKSKVIRPSKVKVARYIEKDIKENNNIIEEE